MAVMSIVRRGLPQFIGFEVLLRTAGLVLFTPATAWLTTALIEWSGDGAVSNYDLAGFFLSARGAVYLTVVVSITFALLFFEFGGLTALAIALQRERKLTLPQLFWFLFGALPLLWRLAIRQFLTYLFYAVPALAATGGAYLLFLTKNDLNYYLLAKPPVFWLTAAVAVISGLGFSFFAVRRFVDWIHAVPLLLFAGVSPVAALRESAELVRGRRREVVRMLLTCLGLFVALILLLNLSMMVLEGVLLGMAGQRVGPVLGITAVLVVVHFLAAGAVAVVGTSSLACAEGRLFLRLRPDVRLAASLSGRESAVIRRVQGVLRASWCIVLVFGGVSMAVAAQLVNKVRLDDEVAITAHRGSSITAPENTMAAILLAVEEGADFVEIDVQETMDGTVVLVHDKDLNRVFGIDKGIWEVSFDELKDLDSGGWFGPGFSDQRLATLDQVIKAVKGRARLNIELKFTGHQKALASEVVRIVRENDFADQCILTSLDYTGIRRVRSVGPEIRTGLIVTTALGDITRLEADLLSVSAGAVTRDLIDRARRAGLEVHVWTVNEVTQMNSMIGIGVDNIITDDPALLGEVLRERGAMSNSEKMLLQIADFANRRF